MSRFIRLVLALLAVFALVSIVSAESGPERLLERARRKGYNAKIKKHSDEKKKREPSSNFVKRATTTPTSSVCISTPVPVSTSPPSCGGNNCANAFNKQFTASFERLTAFCSSWTSGTSSGFAATGTASWAANCVGASTAATQAPAIATKISSLCDCYLPGPTPCPSSEPSGFRFLTSETEPFRVVSLPEVNYDIGEMYSGLMPIDAADPSRALFFVFQPTVGALVDDITIWLNGGPGCSSLEGFFQENGLFVWAWGMYDPQVNPYSWVNLTNVLWLEQPVGTGFSTGTVTATSEEDVAEDFAGFFLNFQKKFGISKFKIYVTGESYAGRYVPYISANFLDKNDTEHFDLSGALMYDPCIGSYELIQEQLVAYPFIEDNNNMIGLNKSYLAKLEGLHETCGYKHYIDKYMSFPALGVQPPAGIIKESCRISNLAEGEAFHPNPCFNSYEINTQWYATDLTFSYPSLTPLYFDRDDVKAAMHAPTGIDWSEYSNGNVFAPNDNSLDPIQKVLPQVIEATNRVLVANGELDFVIMTAGTLLAIQNMTWGGHLGFKSKPDKDIVINLPDLQYYQVFVDNGFDPDYDSSQGTMGVQHYERGLMWAETFLSGHMQPQFQPRSSYRHLQWVLGHIEEL